MQHFRHKLPLTSLIHENLSIVVTFAFSRPVIVEFLNGDFHGEWKYLWKACFEIPELRANRAVLELATQLRLLDNQEDLSGYFRQTETIYQFGEVVKADGAREQLYLRDLTNKILHSAALHWQFEDPRRPILVCRSNDPDRWLRAEVSIKAVAALCGGLMS